MLMDSSTPDGMDSGDVVSEEVGMAPNLFWKLDGYRVMRRNPV